MLKIAVCADTVGTFNRVTKVMKENSRQKEEGSNGIYVYIRTGKWYTNTLNKTTTKKKTEMMKELPLPK